MGQKPPMPDLHAHTLLSDGELCPAELFSRAENAGITAMAVTDHVDRATVEATVPALVAACEAECSGGRLLAVPGAELTHVRPGQIASLAERCRQLGARIILVHGETIVEPVPGGTNRAAIEAGVDVLAHPGMITEQDVELAAQLGVRLEISGRQGHCLTNGRVAALARRAGADLVFGSDSHSPCDLRGRSQALAVLEGAGLARDVAEAVLTASLRLLDSRSESGG
jgi:histidinol phosphatase-like PHP family hydrolase